MKPKNVLFLVLLVVIALVVIVSITPSIGQMNSNADAINRTIDTQRETNGH